MVVQMRVRPPQPRDGPALWLPPHARYEVNLPVPDPITFCLGEQWLNRPLYPRQATLVKVVFLRVDLLTDFDRMVIAEWEQSWLATGNNGTPPRLIERMIWLKELGCLWFREMLLVLGRRGSKGYISALCMAYVLWNYLAKFDPQAYYNIDRNKQLTCLIYAGRKDQARDNLWRDLVNVITHATCFQPYVSKPLGESLSVFAPADRAKTATLARQGIQSGLDAATFRIEPLPATPMSGRGGTGCVIALDEMAHMINAGANRESKEVWDAALPSLAQFGKDAFIVCPSSPWQQIGQFYTECQQAQELNGDGNYLYPDKLMLQLESWALYFDWEISEQIELFPDEFCGDLNEYVVTDLPRLPRFERPVLAEADVIHLEKADPDTFAVEYRSKWQSTLDAYLDPKKIAAMFEGEYPMRTRGPLGLSFKAHGDPGFVNDPFGFSVAHCETGEDGYEHVVFDLIRQWNPGDYEDHTVDYLVVQDEIWELVKDFSIEDLSFDQHNSRGMTSELSRRARESGLPKRCQVHIINETAPYNLKVAETFKIALNQEWIHAPLFDIAELELKFLMFKNGKVTHQTIGPVVHDDVARSMMEVVYALLEKQVAQFLMAGVPLSATMSGGSKPFMHPTDGFDREVIGQFSGAGRRGKTGGGAPFSPSRGKPGFMTGRGPLPRTPGRRI